MEGEDKFSRKYDNNPSNCFPPFSVVCLCHDPVVAEFRDSQSLGRRAAEPAARPDFDHAIELLLALNVAKTLNDLSPLKSVGLHKLKGDRKSQWAMTVNERWRICFEFRKGDAYEVEIVDYHRG
jgi:proteic killer suppression protein